MKVCVRGNHLQGVVTWLTYRNGETKEIKWAGHAARMWGK